MNILNKRNISIFLFFIVSMILYKFLNYELVSDSNINILLKQRYIRDITKYTYTLLGKYIEETKTIPKNNSEFIKYIKNHKSIDANINFFLNQFGSSKENLSISYFGESLSLQKTENKREINNYVYVKDIKGKITIFYYIEKMDNEVLYTVYPENNTQLGICCELASEKPIILKNKVEIIEK